MQNPDPNISDIAEIAPQKQNFAFTFFASKFQKLPQQLSISKDRNESIDSFRLWYHLLGPEINKNWGFETMESFTLLNVKTLYKNT